MALYALDAVGDAYRATRAFLLPVDRSCWLKLAFVGLFVGLPGLGTNSVQWNVPADGTAAPVDGVPALPPGAWLAVVVAAVVALFVALALLFVGSVMEFVFVEALRSEDVRVREFWGRHRGRGLRLFGFRLVLGLVALAGVVALAAVVAVPFVVGDGGASAVFLVLVLLPVFVVLAVLVGLVNGFTTMFVVPVMILEDCGVLEGWRRFWPTVKREWTQYLAYVVASFFLTVAGGIVVGVATAVLAVVLLIPFGLLFALGVALFLTVTPVGVAALVVVGLLFAAAVVAAAAVVQVPVLTYLRYYALLVLGDTNEAFDLIPDRRAAVRD